MFRKRAVFSSLFAFAALLLVGGSLTGCSKDAAVPKTDVDRFQNPPKTMPPAAVEYMKKHGTGGPPAGAK